MRAGDFLAGALDGKFNVTAAMLASAFGKTFCLRHEILTMIIMPDFNADGKRM
jgi:hypothetical protein